MHNIDKIMTITADILPSFIPAEFLNSEQVKVYLSPWSSSIANMEKGTAVSLINLISFRDGKVKESIREQLTKMSRTEILFPESLDEFDEILASISQQTT